MLQQLLDQPAEYDRRRKEKGAMAAASRRDPGL